MSARRKLAIVGNGLRDQLGHYFETCVSVAEAARRAGLHPVLGTHRECPGDLVPAWLESHALFHTDYWMWAKPEAEPSASAPDQPVTLPAPSSSSPAARVARIARRGAFYLLPPLFYDLARLLRYCLLPRIAGGAHRQQARAGLRRLALRMRYRSRAPLIEQASAWPELTRTLRDDAPAPSVVEAAERLLPAGLGKELADSLVFHRDLQRFLAAAAAGPNDHVLLQTAHAREVLAVHLAVESLAAQAPTFHLEFRHPLFADEGSGLIETPQTRMERSFLQLHVDLGRSDRIRFYTDSEALSSDYESLVDLSFGVLPLPFRAELMPRIARPSDVPITMVYLGGARDEKGFHWLPDLIDALADDYLEPGRARLLIQSSLGQPEHNPRSVAALSRLRQQPGVELIGETGALSPAEYYELAARADIMLLPYLRGRYRACTSGVLAEALAAGAAAVVPAGTWLADQLPAGGGELFDDGFETFAAATRRVLDNFPAYRAAAQAHRAFWLKQHSPDALVGALVGERSGGLQNTTRAA